MKAQKTLKALILSLVLVVTLVSTATAQELPTPAAVNNTVTVPAAGDDAQAPTTVRIVQRIADESAAHSDMYCFYEQHQICNYYGCFYQWRQVCYPW